MNDSTTNIKVAKKPIPDCPDLGAMSGAVISFFYDGTKYASRTINAHTLAHWGWERLLRYAVKEAAKKGEDCAIGMSVVHVQGTTWWRHTDREGWLRLHSPAEQKAKERGQWS